MGRKAGARNADFEASRDALVAKARLHLEGPRGAQASFRELADACGVTPTTLRHYFGTREGLIEAALAHAHREGTPYMLMAAAPPTEALEPSIRNLCRGVMMALAHSRLANVHVMGIEAGLGEPTLGPAYVNQILEPTLQAFEARLAHHAARGELVPGLDLRVATLALISPMLLAVLHQHALFGSQCRPLALGAMLEAHLDAWLRGVRAEPSTERQASTGRAKASRSRA
jgi:AcrR family transcriptional regulator